MQARVGHLRSPFRLAAARAAAVCCSASRALLPLPLPSAAPLGACGERAPRRTFFGQKFTVGEIVAVRREATGSRNAQAARQQRLIPGIIYGYDEDGNDKIDLVYVHEADLRREVNRMQDCFYNTLFDM
jgi:ribosomal protein L25 (general stress protein Ctc)